MITRKMVMLGHTRETPATLNRAADGLSISWPRDVGLSESTVANIF